MGSCKYHLTYSSQFIPDSLPTSEPTIDKKTIVRQAPLPPVRSAWQNFRFAALWFSFILIICGIAMLANIDWSRDRLQTWMSTVINRRVECGRLRWIFGLHGLAVEARDLKVFEADGRPFLNAGRSEIGVALLPLIAGQFKIRHLIFNSPELWAVRLKPGTWNFDDLLLTAFNAKFLKADHGLIHLKDQCPLASADAFADTDLIDFNTKLSQPKKLATRPIALSFKIPHNGYATEVDLGGIELHKTENWRTNKFRVKLHVSHFDSKDLKPVATIFNINVKDTLAWMESRHLSGIFDFDAASEGIFDQRFQSAVNMKAKNLAFQSDELGQINIPVLESSCTVKARDNNLAWTNLQFKLPINQIEGRTEGKISNWPALKNASASGNLVALADDLNGLNSIFPQLEAKAPGNLKFIARAKGKAFIDTQFKLAEKQAKFNSQIRVSGVSINKIEELIKSAKIPLVALFGVNDATQITGNVSVNSENRIDLKDCQLENTGGTFKLTGFHDAAQAKGKLDFSVKDYNLRQCSEALKNSPQAKQSLVKAVRLGPQGKLLLAGKANISGSVEQNHEDIALKGELVLRDARIFVSSPRLCIEHVNGTIQVQPDKQVLRQLSGAVNGGRIEISGSLPGKSNGVLDLHIRASDFDLNYLSSLMQLFQIDSTIFANHQLSGPVKELVLDLTGTPARPTTQFVVTPQMLCYQPQGLAEALKANSGTITYKNDRLELKDVGIALPGGPVVTSLSIASLSNNARLERIKVKTSSTDLKDAHHYLISSLSPVVLRNLYVGFMDNYKLSYPHGKVYGDIACTIGSGKPQIDGLIGFINAGGKVGEAKQPVEHVSGILVASGQQLLLQGLSGSIHNSQFELDGRINHYQDVDPHWSGEFRANINPLELTQWIPLLASEDLMNGQLQLTAARPLSLKAKLSGHNGASSGTFSVAADPEDRLTLTGPFGVLHQPPGERLLFDGSIKIDPHTIQVSDARLALGSSTLRGEGSLAKILPNFGAKNGKAVSEVNFHIRSLDQVSLKSMIGLLDPSLASEDVSGTIKGFVSIKGRMSEPTFSSDISFDRVALPQFDLANASGKLATNEPQKITAEMSGIKARLNLDSLSLGKVHLSGVNAGLEWQPSANNLKAPKIALSNCQATLAGGTLSGEGWLDLDEHKVSVKANLKGARAGKLLEEMADLKGELTGLLDADTNMQTSGENSAALFANLKGSGDITVRQGTVSRFGPLKTKLNQGNLVHQGLFGFNLNNVLKSVAPERSGNFQKLETSFHLANGHLSVEKLRYEGDDLKLWATGQANIRLHTVELEIEGKIPRVSNGVIGGPFGELSRDFTVQKVVGSVTLHKLEGLPSLPLLGDLASDKPTTFTFKVLAPYDQPKLVSQSIEKSFRWREHKANQASHNLPSLDARGQL